MSESWSQPGGKTLGWIKPETASLTDTDEANDAKAASGLANQIKPFILTVLTVASSFSVWMQVTQHTWPYSVFHTNLTNSE